MLVLTRRSGESLRIGTDVRITVISSTGTQVRLGIEAPAHVAVHREEVFERIASANREAAELPVAALEAIVSQGRAREEEGGEE